MRKVQKLSALGVARRKGDGLYGDGLGLYLQVRNGAKSWIFRARRPGRRATNFSTPFHDLSCAVFAKTETLLNRDAILAVNPLTTSFANSSPIAASVQVPACMLCSRH
jgi:hypothetical protein